eukprot:6262282-Prymnesium_polylepis.1
MKIVCERLLFSKRQRKLRVKAMACTNTILCVCYGPTGRGTRTGVTRDTDVRTFGSVVPDHAIRRD